MNDSPPYPPLPPHSAPRRSGKAVAALVLGILGVVTCGPFAAIPAIVVGRSAQREIDASGGLVTGRGSATAGVVLGWVEIAIMALGAIVVAAIYVFGGDVGLGSN